MMQTTTQNVGVVPGHDGSTYPNYSKTSSLGLGIFHVVIVFEVLIASVIGLALVEPGGPKGALEFSMICTALVSMHECVCVREYVCVRVYLHTRVHANIRIHTIVRLHQVIILEFPETVYPS